MENCLLAEVLDKMSLRVGDLADYLDVSRTTVYNYRTTDFCRLPAGKRYKLLELFQCKTEEELKELLDSNDSARLVKSLDVAEARMREKKGGQRADSADESRAAKTRADRLLEYFETTDSLTLRLLIETLARITKGMSGGEIKRFLEYMEIYEKYRAYSSESDKR